MEYRVFAGRTSLSVLLLVCALGATAQICTPAFDAQYNARFVATWSAQTLPQQFPPNPHFSNLVGAVHDGSVSFWSAGTVASAGIEQMAETGATGGLQVEVNGAINAGTAQQVITGGGIGNSPGTAAADFAADQNFSRVTLVSMIAPSPDWFVGVSGLDLFVGGTWAEFVAVTLYGYDAGTDSGTTYTAANADTQPPDVISALDGPLFRVDGALVPFGRFEFTRIGEGCVDSDGDSVSDLLDNCITTPNAAQVDADGDGHGNACDADLDNSCVVNAVDLGLLRNAFFGADGAADFNSDGVVNVVDLGIMRTLFFGAPGPSANGICTE